MPNVSKLDSHWRRLVCQVSEVIDLDASARAAKALVRRREIRSGDMLLRLALAYGPGGLSLRSAAAWAGASGLANMSDTAVMNRIRGAADWLGEIAGALLQRSRLPQNAARAVAGLANRRLRIVDGSVITQPGSQGADWRLHATFDPAAGRFTDLDLTDHHGAESFARATLAAGDVALGDRCFAKPGGLLSVLDRGADFIVRVGHGQLRLLRPDGTILTWPALFAGLPAGGVIEQPVIVAKAGKGLARPGRPLFEARLIVCRLSDAATRRGECGARRKHGKCRARAVLNPLTVQSAGFLMVLTSLPPAVSTAEVVAAYRVRWQVELAFKRLKSLLGLDRLPAKSRVLARSWLLAHLILALLIQDTAQDIGRSPPLQPATQRGAASLWRITHALRDAMLAAIRGLLPALAWRNALASIARHLCERPRQRKNQQCTLRPSWPL